MKIESSYNFRRLSAQLTSSGVVARSALEALAAQGYQVVVNLLPDSSEHAVLAERQIVEAQGLEYIHIPVDFKQPERADFTAFCAALDRVGAHQVHLHCAANFRVSAFYALYQVRRGAWDAARAREFIASVWQPHEHAGWAEFIDAILESS
jgi:uncharacterized protein (TIGR01244 family)